MDEEKSPISKNQSIQRDSAQEKGGWERPCPIPSPRPHLRQKSAGAAPGVEHPLGEESAELAAGERPASHPAAALPRRPPQQIRLPGLLRCQDREGLARGRCQAGCGGTGDPPTPAGTGCCVQESPVPPQTAPSSYLAGFLWLNVKERREGLQPRGGRHPPRAELVSQTTTAPLQTPVTVPMPVLPSRSGFAPWDVTPHPSSCTELGSPKPILIPDLCFGDCPKLGGNYTA